MYKRFINLVLLFIFEASLLSCSTANNKPLSVGFSSDSLSIVFSDIHAAGMHQLRNTPGIDSTFRDLISVVELPQENGTKGVERHVPGRLAFTDSTIVFHPSTAFVKGKTYMVMSYLNAKFSDPAMIFSGKMNHGVRSTRVVLKR